MYIHVCMCTRYLYKLLMPMATYQTIAYFFYRPKLPATNPFHGIFGINIVIKYSWESFFWKKMKKKIKWRKLFLQHTCTTPTEYVNHPPLYSAKNWSIKLRTFGKERQFPHLVKTITAWPSIQTGFAYRFVRMKTECSVIVCAKKATAGVAKGWPRKQNFHLSLQK